MAGKIVACIRGISARVEKGAVVLEAGGIGMILGNPPVSGNDIVADPHVLPATMVDANDAIEIFSYIADTRFKSSPYLQISLQNYLHRKDTCEVHLVMDGLSQLFQLGTLACIVEIEISVCTIPITNQVINHGSYFENIESSLWQYEKLDQLFDQLCALQWWLGYSSPMAQITPAVTILGIKPAPIMASFSSQGPSTLPTDVLKVLLSQTW